MKNSNLKCCPFCGHNKVDVNRTNKNACWISCCNCEAQSEYHATRKIAFANWNRRKEIKKYAVIEWDDEDN